jgi:hypothetical protein
MSKLNKFMGELWNINVKVNLLDLTELTAASLLFWAVPWRESVVSGNASEFYYDRSEDGRRLGEDHRARKSEVQVLSPARTFLGG